MKLEIGQTTFEVAKIFGDVKTRLRKEGNQTFLSKRKV